MHYHIIQKKNNIEYLQNKYYFKTTSKIIFNIDEEDDFNKLLDHVKNHLFYTMTFLNKSFKEIYINSNFEAFIQNYNLPCIKYVICEYMKACMNS